jgi:hypothetical protein
MKKIFAIVLSAAALLMGTQAYAQLSVGAGWLNSTETVKSGNSDPSKTNLNGFYVGGQYNLPIVSGLGVAPGLYVSGIFAKLTDSAAAYGLTGSQTATSREFDINVPVNVNYAFEIGRDFKVFLYAGPVFQLGIVSKASYEASAGIAGIGGVSTGKYTTDNYSGKTFDSSNKEVGQHDGGYQNPFNIYLGGGAGIQSGAFQVIIGYDHSLLNFSKNSNETASRSQIKLGVGYAF